MGPGTRNSEWACLEDHVDRGEAKITASEASDFEAQYYVMYRVGRTDDIS